jgi:hypothetical protein
MASALKMRPKKRKFTKYARDPIYKKLYTIWKEKVHLIAGHVLDRSALSALNHGACAQYCVTTHKFHGTAMKAMAARATHISRVYVDVLDPGPHAQAQVRSIISLCTRSQR